MTWNVSRCLVLAAALCAPLSGCGLLDVSDPTAIEDAELTSADGANLLRMDALRQLYVAYGTSAAKSATLTDEMFTDLPGYFHQFGYTHDDEILDMRQSQPYETYARQHYADLQAVRKAATLAMPGLRTYTGPARVGEMFVIRGYATLVLAENFCPGVALHDIVDRKPVYGGPLTTDEVFERALKEFDSALTYAADSARIADWARVGRGRALLGLGRFAEAAQAVSAVPVGYIVNAEFDWYGQQVNPFFQYVSQPVQSAVRGLSDHEGGNGLDFGSAGDPRVAVNPVGVTADGLSPLRTPKKYAGQESKIVLASGVEARLIEAEAALHAGDVTTWRAKLNDPRQNAWNTIVPAASGPLTDLPDPGTDEARLDLTFRERAFWLWGTSHRLGDLRRLVARYGRAVEDVFPNGAYRMGGSYSTATSIPFQADPETQVSPTVTGCTTR